MVFAPVVLAPVLVAIVRCANRKASDCRPCVRLPSKPKARFRLLASALGLRVLRVLSVDENGSTPMPIRHIMLALARPRAEEEATPIEAGTLNVSADITLTVEVGEGRGEAP
jgi:hypothetical protein